MYNRKIKFLSHFLTAALLLLVILFFGLWAFYENEWAVYFLVPVAGFTLFSWFTLYIKKRRPRTGEKKTITFFPDHVELGKRTIKYTELKKVVFDTDDDSFLSGTPHSSGVHHVKTIWTLAHEGNLYFSIHFYRDGWNKAGEPYNIYELFSVLRKKDHFMYRLLKDINEINFMNQSEK